MEDIWSGLQACYADLKQNVRELYGETLTTLGAVSYTHLRRSLDKYSIHKLDLRDLNLVDGRCEDRLYTKYPDIIRKNVLR